jgi:membrane protease subunit (stomatin/prohibitin family)
MAKVLDVIEFFDDAGTTMVARITPRGEAEIKWGAQLIVRESQTAVFFRDGKAQVTFGPGRHVLKTQNTPVLTKLITSTVYGAESPFRAEVYFLNMKLFRNLKWGTKEPILFRDPELQMVRLRSNGMYSIQIKEPNLFLNRMVGTQHIFHDQDIHDYLRSIITSRLVTVLGEQLKTIFDLPKYYDALGGLLKAVLADDFKACGLEMVDFFINAISIPEDVQKTVDEKTSIHAIGDLGKYTQFKVARSIEEASKQTGGAAGTGVGVGAGVSMGMMLPGIIKEAMKGDQTPEAQPSETEEDIFAKIEKLKKLLDMGALTQEEFDRKKAELLSRI